VGLETGLREIGALTNPADAGREVRA
jgi:hypothetical protein